MRLFIKFPIVIALFTSFLGAAAVGNPTENPRFSMKFEDLALDGALTAFAKKAGVRIELKGTNPERSVSVTLRNVSLNEGLHRILAPWDHVIIWPGNDRIEVHILGPKEQIIRPDPDPADDAGEDMYFGDDVIVPPTEGDPFPFDLTFTDLSDRAVALDWQAAGIDPVPDEEGDEVGFNRWDLEEALSRPPESVANVTLIPDEDGLNPVDVNSAAIGLFQRDFDPASLQIIPPEDQGSNEIKLEDLSRRSDSEQPTPAFFDPLVDAIPP
jgi:hypothetical protein